MRPAKLFANVEDYRLTGKGEQVADYLYLYADGKWLVYGLYNESDWVEIKVEK